MAIFHLKVLIGYAICRKNTAATWKQSSSMATVTAPGLKISGLTYYHVIDRMLCSCKVEGQSYKACMGLLQLSKKYDTKRLEAACKKAIALSSMNFTTVSIS